MQETAATLTEWCDRCSNLVKAAIIQSNFNAKHRSVLDLGCGKGGDLRKYQREGYEFYYGYDQFGNPDDWKTFNTRSQNVAMKINIHKQDFTQELQGAPANVGSVGCFFAAQFAFQSPAALEQFLDNVASALVDGGTFFGIVPDAATIAARSAHGTAPFEVGFPTAVCRIECKENTQLPLFGDAYKFSRLGYNLLEPMAYFPLLVTMAEERGLKLLNSQHLPEHFASVCGDEKHREAQENILKDMKPNDREWGVIWDYLALYRTFVFQLRRR